MFHSPFVFDPASGLLPWSLASALLSQADDLAIRAPSVRDILRSTRRLLALSPTQKGLRKLRARGVHLGSLRALELFGGRGVYHTLDYASRISSLEVWEIDPLLESDLRRNLPRATVRIVDCHEEIKRTSGRFNFLVVDNPMSTYGGHCEHFDLFPDLFRVACDESIVLLDVIPSAPPIARKKYPYLFNEEQRGRRRAFYQTDDPDNVSWETIVAAYRTHAELAGFGVDWSFTVRRHFVYYLALKISRKAIH
jgi:hypothetical protein